MDTSRGSYRDSYRDNYMDNCRGSSKMNSGMDNRFSPDSYNKQKDHIHSPIRWRDNQRACIHYQKPNWEEARPVLDYPIVLSKLVLPVT